jgi:pre-rRNA-processing protein TSR1
VQYTMSEQLHTPHRPTLKQVNKPFKSRFATKGEIKRRNKGRVDDRSEQRLHIKNVPKDISRNNRKNMAKQFSRQKREAVLLRKRLGHTADSPPILAALVALSQTVDIDTMFTYLLQHCEAENFDPHSRSPVTMSVSRFKTRLTLYKTKREIISVLDIAKVADIILFGINVNEEVDSLGLSIIAALKAQGVPSVMGLIQGLSHLKSKHQTEAKRNISKFFHSQFSDEPRVLTLDTVEDAAQVVRFLCDMKIKSVHWRECRPYLLAERIIFKAHPENPHVGTLLLTGYLRGNRLNPNNLVHLPDYGDFQVTKIELIRDPYPLSKVRKHLSNNSSRPSISDDVPMSDVTSLSNTESDISMIGNEVLKVWTPDVTKQETLQTENVPDPLANEQTFPTNDELHDIEETLRNSVCRATDIQAAWILDDGEDYNENGKDSDEEMEDTPFESQENDSTFQQTNNERKDKVKDSESLSVEVRDDGDDTEDKEENYQTIDMEISKPQKNQFERKTKEESEKTDLEFPDEVDVPFDQPARIRFQKYRGLKSFRTSPWDPRENLPRDYARIYQFQNFSRTKRRVLSELNEGPEPGNYITVHIGNVPADIFQSCDQEAPLILGGLLRYENKMSVVNFTVKKHSSYQNPIQAKEEVIFHTGFRRYRAYPIYSEHNHNCDKHKYIRWLHAGQVEVATVIGPISFPPMPLLVFHPVTSNIAYFLLFAFVI